jgi:hypothetical protein
MSGRLERLDADAAFVVDLSQQVSTSLAVGSEGDRTQTDRGWIHVSNAQ